MATLSIRRLGYALGAEVRGVDLRRPLEDATVAEIRRAWLDHIVLCFPQQDLHPEEFLGFAGRFGELDDGRPSPRRRHPDYFMMTVLSSKPVNVASNFAGREKRIWHTDGAYTVQPSPGTFLNARKLPPAGGDTMFTNMYLAYETLSPKLREIAETLECVHDISRGGGSREKIADLVRHNPPAIHPMVRTHPETGRKSLFVDMRVAGIAGMTDVESKPLLDYLRAHAVRYEFVYRHRWQLHDLLMWDNRCALHYPVLDYDEERVMNRCGLLGPVTGRPAEAATAETAAV